MSASVQDSKLRCGVVLGAAVGFRPSELGPFIGSAQRLRPNWELLLLRRAGWRARQTWAESSARSVGFICRRGRVDRRNVRGFAERVVVRGMGEVIDRCRPLLPPRLYDQRLRTTTPNDARLIAYRRLLRGELRECPWVFLTDTRDVIFQGDPDDEFRRLTADAPVHLFDEGGLDPAQPRGAIRDDEWNSGWIRRLAGEEGLDGIGDRVPICSGTMLGRPAALADVVDQMIIAIGSVPARKVAILDQGALNLLLYRGILDDIGVTVHRNGTGPVVTISRSASAVRVHDGVVYLDGMAPPVVHQYDRLSQRDAIERHYSQQEQT